MEKGVRSMKTQDLLNQSKPLSNGVYGEEGRKLASSDWNARPIENELEAENARLREELESSRYLTEEEAETNGVQEVFQ